ncbi:hypothetical protein B0I35DRAFT_188870 [Stachybotrys elegans]|uniref:Secreted protein n=1 Tax=Stachybotrys elegans TaxID=80388 RepID=A0A8K0T026_9HYPO|nr:hypothetical protein B0I35DRAFT_188870 [Stachybotrys elegans]
MTRWEGHERKILRRASTARMPSVLLLLLLLLLFLHMASSLVPVPNTTKPNEWVLPATRALPSRLRPSILSWRHHHHHIIILLRLTHHPSTLRDATQRNATQTQRKRNASPPSHPLAYSITA